MDHGLFRRGQAASGAAILIAIIAGFLIVYILFLPPGQREQLLFGDGAVSSGGGYGGAGGSGGGVFTQYGSVLILSASPGTLRLQRSSVSEHPIPSATIFTAVRTQEIKSVDSAIIKNGLFARQDLELTFNADPQMSKNYLLSFNVGEAASSPLRVLVNGRTVYERPVWERTPQPIPLPNDLLVNGENRVTVQVGETGFAFWKPNAYILSNILVSGDILDVSGAHSIQTFSIDESEIDSMESAQIQFVPDCDPKKAGRLLVQMNSRVVVDPQNRTTEVPNILYNGFVDCGILFKTDVAKENLRAGENGLLFASQGGQYVIDRIKVVVNLKENDYPTWYFNIPADMFDTLDSGRGALRLTMVFSDYRNAKNGEVVINGFVQSFSTQQYIYQAMIDPGILTPGPNTIQIAPHVDKLDIAEMKIELV